MNLVILGAPGSGKGTQAKILAEKANLKHVSSGDLLREAVERQDELGKEVEAIMAEGKLVPDQTVLRLVRDAILEYGDREGWILDGYPRTGLQAEALEDVLSSAREVIDAVIYLEVEADAVIERLEKRGRKDDTADTIKKRLEVYEKETMPVLEFYELRYDVHRVNGARSIEDVAAEIAGLVDL
jgi:adenylate kinase